MRSADRARPSGLPQQFVGVLELHDLRAVLLDSHLVVDRLRELGEGYFIVSQVHELLAGNPAYLRRHSRHLRRPLAPSLGSQLCDIVSIPLIAITLKKQGLPSFPLPLLTWATLLGGRR